MQSFEVKLRLNNSSGFDSGPEHILLSGDVMRRSDSVQTVEIKGCRVVELIFSGSGEAVLNSFVAPESLH